MRYAMRWALLMAVALAVAGCGSGAALTGGTAGGARTPSAGSARATPAPAGGDYTSAVLATNYEGALPASAQLALGILRLEGTADAVTPEQARTLLPLWQALQGTALRNDEERAAVLRQVERALTPEQLAAIAALRLTQDDARAWMEAQGMPPGTPFPGAQGGPFGDMTEEERAAFRATAQASGQVAGGRFGNMSEAERAAFRATVEASGGQFPAPRGTPQPGGFGRAGASYRLFAAPLVRLLTERAAQ